MVTTYGQVELVDMKVWSDVVLPDTGVEGRAPRPIGSAPRNGSRP
jgi:hypothetical protein